MRTIKYRYYFRRENWKKSKSINGRSKTKRKERKKERRVQVEKNSCCVEKRKKSQLSDRFPAIK